MADNVHTKELMNQTVTLITTDQPLGAGDMNLLVVDINNIEDLVARGDLSNHLPAVLVQPSGVINPEFQNLRADHMMVYVLRLLLIDEYGPAVNNLEVKVDQMKFLANIFMTNANRYTPPEAHVTMLFQQVTEIDYVAEEEDALQHSISDRIWAASLTLEIHASTQRV